MESNRRHMAETNRSPANDGRSVQRHTRRWRGEVFPIAIHGQMLDQHVGRRLVNAASEHRPIGTSLRTPVERRPLFEPDSRGCFTGSSDRPIWKNIPSNGAILVHAGSVSTRARNGSRKVPEAVRLERARPKMNVKGISPTAVCERAHSIIETGGVANAIGVQLSSGTARGRCDYNPNLLWHSISFFLELIGRFSIHDIAIV